MLDTKAVARTLRRDPTPAEKAMWRLLRDRRLRRLKFRRQFTIHPFVVDFCCYELRLIVELDGDVHAEPRQAAHDANRDWYLRSLGYTVLRFANREVFRDPQGVLERVFETAWRKGWVE